MMAFAAAGRSAAAARLLETLPHGDANGPSPSMPEETLAPPSCRALLAYACGDYAACVRGLIRVRDCASLWRKPCSVRLDPSDLHRGQRCGRERCRAERCATSERARGQEGKRYNV